MNILTWVLLLLTWSFLKSELKIFLFYFFTRLVVLVVLLNYLVVPVVVVQE